MSHMVWLSLKELYFLGWCDFQAVEKRIEADSNSIMEIRRAVPDVPVFSGTGCKAHNIIQKLEASDGACVGTTFKVDGKFDNHIDPERVKEFMAQVAVFRREHPDIA